MRAEEGSVACFAAPCWLMVFIVISYVVFVVQVHPLLLFAAKETLNSVLRMLGWRSNLRDILLISCQQDIWGKEMSFFLTLLFLNFFFIFLLCLHQFTWRSRLIYGQYNQQCYKIWDLNLPWRVVWKGRMPWSCALSISSYFKRRRAIES